MAGMLPGVEVARRRRFHQSGGWLDSHHNASSSSSGHGSTRTRRSSFCLYAGNYESHLSSSMGHNLLQQRSPFIQLFCDQKLNDAAREAKERLDGRLRAQWKSETKRVVFNGQERSIQSEDRPTDLRGLHRQVFGLKRRGSKRFSWPKLMSWKSSEQDECAVCLEQFKAGENLMKLPCAHRFHSRCLVPWLENSTHCPCCRMELTGISSKD